MPLTHRGYDVQVEVEGEELSQFQVEKTNERTMTCWIPSEAGKAFSVRTRTVDDHDHEYKAVKVFADGRKLQAYGGEDERSHHIQYRVASTTSREPFVFSQVAFELADEEDVNHVALSEDVGVIKVEIWSTRRVTNASGTVFVQASHAADAGIKLSEKSKLIGANHVKPGAAENHVWTPSPFYYNDIETQPYAVFRFKHRPKELLQALGVMPRPVRAPTPPAVGISRPAGQARPPSPREPSRKRRRTDDEVEDVKPTLNDAEDLEARRRRIEADMAALQAELAGLGPQEPMSTRVKAERAPSPIHVPQHGEVIDLTDD